MTEVPFLIEARELADDEHHGLTRELEIMRDHPCDYGSAAIYWWKRENIWRDDPADFFEANRDYYLEQARELFAENLA